VPSALASTLLVVASVALVLVSAKAHGRQLRLEREWAGFEHVEFGATNPPWVEALWRRDRVRFWTIVPLAAAAMLGHALASPLAHPAALKGWGALFAAAWAPAVGFVALALASLARLRRATRGSGERPAWRAAAARGSAAWLGASGALALVVLALAW
jgi:hypothetical protein